MLQGKKAYKNKWNFENKIIELSTKKIKKTNKNEKSIDISRFGSDHFGNFW